MRYIFVKKEIRFGLIFFCVLFLAACKNAKESPTSFELHDTHGKFTSIDITYAIGKSGFQVFVGSESQTAVLGEWTHLKSGRHQFVPVLPFEPGQTYTVRHNQKIIGAFSVPIAHTPPAPEILAIYPSTDTVPENLLKVYIQFSEPMQQVGHPLDFITVIDKTDGVEREIFLNIASELWNRNHDLLTLWLDPGRIKTDLIPNEQQGLPLDEGHTYEIFISDEWKSAQGQPLVKAYTKFITVDKRDSESPDVTKWKLQTPEPNTKGELTVSFNEPMDAVLSVESFSVVDHLQHQIEGSFRVHRAEKKVSFTPKKSWGRGTYTLQVDPILEDLAGNNLDHLFDVDLANSTGKRKGYRTTMIFELK